MTHKLPPPLAVWLRNGVNVWFRARVRLVGARRFIAVSRIPIPENMPDFVRIEMEDRLAVVTINRPEAMNALNSRLLKELSMAIEHLSMAADVGAIVLTGAGDRAFVAGADIKEMVGLSALEMRSFSEAGRRLGDVMSACNKPILAATAERIGLVNRVVPADRLLEETKAVARKIMEKSPAAIALAKACLRASMEMPLAAGLDLETAAFGVVGSTKDKEEGTRAFIEKRKPSWTGA